MKNNLFDNLIIFEMANNHQGDLKLGKELIETYAGLAQKYGLHAAVKTQYRDLPNFIRPDCRGSGHRQAERFLSTRLSARDFREMVEQIKARGLTAMCTPFDEASVDLACEHQMDILKVASCSALDWPLNEKIAQTGKPVIISTAGLSIADIDKIYNFFTHRQTDFALMHCCALYPSPGPALQMNFLDRLKRRYTQIPIGYSGHESPGNLDVVKVAVAKGAVILERHVGLPSESVKLNAYSMNPAETEDWLRAIVSTKELCGGETAYEVKRVSSEERESLRALTRGVCASRPISRGELITQEAIYLAMPCEPGQLSSGELRAKLIATRDYATHDSVTEAPPRSEELILRDIIHEAKGLLMEHQVTVGDDVEFELSHHYGRAAFRQWGAILINIVNREYCKKLIVVLPGQRHPAHHHKSKEESFQVLAGKLTLVLNGQEMVMSPGEIVTVYRGVSHSFTSVDGAIFEEISTSHIKNDSYYEDCAINSSDIISRKTVLKAW